MHSPKSNNLKDLKLLMGKEKIYVVTEEDHFTETSTVFAAFKTFMGARAFARDAALKARREDEYIEDSEFSVEVRDSADACWLEFSIKELILNA